MWKKHKRILLITSLLILLPLIVGVCCWNLLPENVPMHFGPNGQPDRYGSRAEAVLVLPLCMLVLQWVLVLVVDRDRGNRNQSRKVTAMALWVVPCITVFVSVTQYIAAFGRVTVVLPMLAALLGVMFLVIGNYMPKCKYNRTVGIRIWWTLADEANWNATHRFAGRVWVIGGVALLLSALLPAAALPWVVLAGVLLLAAIPVLYSWRYHRRNKG